MQRKSTKKLQKVATLTIYPHWGIPLAIRPEKKNSKKYFEQCLRPKKNQ